VDTIPECAHALHTYITIQGEYTKLEERMGEGGGNMTHTDGVYCGKGRCGER